jgi:HlyD family secretion protein
MKNNIHISLIITAVLAIVLSSCGKPIAETKPIRKDVNQTVFASGVLEADQMYKLTAQSSGYLTELNIREGDIVAQGQFLAEIQDKDQQINVQGASQLLEIAQNNASASGPLLTQAQANIDIAKEKMEQDKKVADRYARLWKSNSIAKIDYENALLAYQTSKGNYEIAVDNYKKLQEDARQQVISNQTSTKLHQSAKGKTRIEAVVSGKVYKKHKELGDYVRPGDVIAEIGSPELIYAMVNIDESNISKVKVGQEAVIQLNTNKNNYYRAEVKEILPAFDEASQSFLCKLYFTDSLDFKIINTQLQTNIMVGGQQNALLIPRNYLDFGGNVQIKGEKGKTKVETQFVSSEWVQVLSGIDENTVLITDNIASK